MTDLILHPKLAGVWTMIFVALAAGFCTGLLKLLLYRQRQKWSREDGHDGRRWQLLMTLAPVAFALILAAPMTFIAWSTQLEGWAWLWAWCLVGGMESSLVVKVAKASWRRLAHLVTGSAVPGYGAGFPDMGQAQLPELPNIPASLPAQPYQGFQEDFQEDLVEHGPGLAVDVDASMGEDPTLDAPGGYPGALLQAEDAPYRPLEFGAPEVRQLGTDWRRMSLGSLRERLHSYELDSLERYLEGQLALVRHLKGEGHEEARSHVG